MSAIATAWAWAQTELDPPQLLTLLALAEGANHQGQCWPSRAILVGMTSMSEAAVAHALKELESKGVLRRESKDGSAAQIFLSLQSAPAVTPPPRREIVPFDAAPSLAAQMEAVIECWNVMAESTRSGNPAHKLAKVQKLNEAGKRSLAARIKEFGVDSMCDAVDAIQRNAHCRGVNDKKWKADFSYLLQAKGSQKTINGGWPADYEEMTNGGNRTGPSGRGDQRIDGLRGFDQAVRGHAAGGDGRQGGGEERRPEPEVAGRGAGSPQPRLALGGPDQRE